MTILNELLYDMLFFASSRLIGDYACWLDTIRLDAVPSRLRFWGEGGFGTKIKDYAVDWATSWGFGECGLKIATFGEGSGI